jgi:hypothetical protein
MSTLAVICTIIVGQMHEAGMHLRAEYRQSRAAAGDWGADPSMALPPVAYVIGNRMITIAGVMDRDLPDAVKRQNLGVDSVFFLSHALREGNRPAVSAAIPSFQPLEDRFYLPWRVSRGSIWVTGFFKRVDRLPLNDWDLFNPDVSGYPQAIFKKYPYPKGSKDYADGFPASWSFEDRGGFSAYSPYFLEYYNAMYEKYLASLTPAKREQLDPFDITDFDAWLGDLFHMKMDVLPDSSNSGTLVTYFRAHTAFKGKLALWEVSANWDATRNRWQAKSVPKAPFATVDAPPVMSRLFGDKKELLFVTREGSFYSALAVEDTKYVLKKRYEDPKNPIRFIVNDARRNRTFVLCKGEPSKYKYFELKVPVQIKDVELDGSPKHPQEVLYGFSRFLLGREIEIE